VYHVAVNYRMYRERRWTLTARAPDEGGWSVLGGLMTVPASLPFDSIVGIPLAVFWDHMAVAIAVGGMFIRFGCVCNGCCVGRDSDAWFAVRQHDVSGACRRRVPVHWLEIVWWLLACAGLAWLWPLKLPAGSCALAVLGWYGLGRTWLQPLRRSSTLVHGIRVDQVVAALLACVSFALLLQRL
jgi:prolipoprotein diacylglyceryltransferase